MLYRASCLKISHGVKQNAKNVPLVKQNVMKLRKKGWGEGEERGLRKGAEREKRDKKELVNNLKRTIRNIDTCLCLLFSFLKALSFRLDSAVKHSSSEL